MQFKPFIFVEETCYVELTKKANIVELLLYFAVKSAQTSKFEITLVMEYLFLVSLLNLLNKYILYLFS